MSNLPDLKVERYPRCTVRTFPDGLLLVAHFASQGEIGLKECSAQGGDIGNAKLTTFKLSEAKYYGDAAELLTLEPKEAFREYAGKALTETDKETPPTAVLAELTLEFKDERPAQRRYYVMAPPSPDSTPLPPGLPTGSKELAPIVVEKHGQRDYFRVFNAGRTYIAVIMGKVKDVVLWAKAVQSDSYDAARSLLIAACVQWRGEGARAIEPDGEGWDSFVKARLPTD